MKRPHILIAILPLVALVSMIAFSLNVFDIDSMTGGASQLSLIIASAVCSALSMGIYGTKWKPLEHSICNTVATSSASIVILMLIGMMSASWMVSGVVPLFIYYGVQIISPTLFLITACIICAIISLITGSSWTTIATIGIAMLGIGNALGIPDYWTAGAIISGAYFGDKISPLSDTTVLASTAAQVDIFVHISYMLRTTIPTFIITLIIFGVAGFMLGGSGTVNVDKYVEILDRTYNITLWVLLVPIITCILIAKKVSSIVCLLCSSLVAAIAAVIFQPHIIAQIEGSGIITPITMLKGVMHCFYTSTSIDTGDAQITDLTSTSGMAGMLNTIWLILCAMAFGGVMKTSGMLASITSAVLKIGRGAKSLVPCTAATGIIFNFTLGDQYMSIVMAAEMYGQLYDDVGYERRLLSRTVEDSTTVTSVLIPWNSCGMTQSAVLGIATLTYLPFCFFNYLSPVTTIIVGTFVRKRKTKDERRRTKNERRRTKTITTYRIIDTSNNRQL